MSSDERQKRLDAALAAAREAGGQTAVGQLMDELFQEQARYDAMLRDASDAALKAAPRDMPKVRDRNLGVGIGLVQGGACYVFETDAGLAQAEARKLTDWLANATREELLARGYPRDAIDGFSVRFTTHEMIVREAGGDYHTYFQ